MAKRSRQYLIALLFPLSALAGPGSGVAAQEHHAHVLPDEAPAPQAVRSVRWSDPAAWPGGKVPAKGDAVMIARDTEVLLDVSPPALRSLTVHGTLRFSDERDLDLLTECI